MRKVKHVLSWVFAAIAYLAVATLLFHFFLRPSNTQIPWYVKVGLQSICLIVAMCVLNFCASRGWYQIDEAFSKPFQLFTKPRHITEREEALKKERQRILAEAQNRKS